MSLSGELALDAELGGTLFCLSPNKLKFLMRENVLGSERAESAGDGGDKSGNSNSGNGGFQ